MCLFGKVTPKDMLADRYSVIALAFILIIDVICFCYSYVRLRDAFRLKYKESVIQRIVEKTFCSKKSRAYNYGW